MPSQVIANLYAAVNELVEAFTLDQAQMQAAEPFAPDFWVPGHFYRENLVLLGGLPQSDTDERKPVGAALTRTFALRANGSAYALTMERWQGHCKWMRAADAPGEKALVISTTLFY
jgi:hypothetical protein